MRKFGPVWRENGGDNDCSHEAVSRVMYKAASSAGLTIEGRSLSSVFGVSGIAVAATVEGLEMVSAKSLCGGADIGFIYLQDAASMPDGFFTAKLTIDADPVTLGRNPARVEVIDRQGVVVMRDTTDVTVESLTVPDDRPPGFVPAATAGVFPDPDRCAFRICFLCSNLYGVICLRFPIATCFWFGQ